MAKWDFPDPKKPEIHMPTTSRAPPPRRSVSLTWVKVSKMRFSSSSILSVTTYSRNSAARGGLVEDLHDAFDLPAEGPAG